MFCLSLITACAPPVGSYDPKTLEKAPAALLDSKDERFKEPRRKNLYLLLLSNLLALFTFLKTSLPHTFMKFL